MRWGARRVRLRTAGLTGCMPSIGFRNPEVSLEGATLVVRGGIENQSGITWSPAEGWAAGYHLFDDPTGTLVVDGERTPLDLAPGSVKPFRMQIATPPEPGEYSIYVSAMQEHVAWLYEQGWPFLLITVVVSEDGSVRLRR